MNKQQASESPSVSAKDFLLSIIEGTVNYFDSAYPQSVFWMKDGLVYFELDFENGDLWCRYDRVWKVLSDKFSLIYENTQSLIKSTVEESFKLGGLTPCQKFAAQYEWVEERFKLGGLTPKTRMSMPHKEEIYKSLLKKELNGRDLNSSAVIAYCNREQTDAAYKAMDIYYNEAIEDALSVIQPILSGTQYESLIDKLKELKKPLHEYYKI